jgi:hypothetical protein
MVSQRRAMCQRHLGMIDTREPGLPEKIMLKSQVGPG